VAAALGPGAESMVVRPPAAPSAGEAAVALAGKTLRGSRQPGAPGGHLLVAVSRHVGLPLAHQAVDDKTKEITQGETGLRQRLLPGRGLTRDALLPPRQVAQPIGEAGGDDVMIVKAHQPRRRADIAFVCTGPPTGDRPEPARTVDIGHGRRAPRHITTSAARGGDSAWPGLAQVFEFGRHVITKQPGKDWADVVDGVPSLRPERTTPGRL
jgi:hypothetical protein